MLNGVQHSIVKQIAIYGAMLFPLFTMPIAGADTQVTTRQHPLEYRNPGLAVDLGVGLGGYALPMDYDHDGDMDLLVASTDTIQEGLYFFENTSGERFPIFKPARRIGGGQRVRLSYVGGQPLILGPRRDPNVGWCYNDFAENALDAGRPISYDQTFHHNWSGQWSAVDYDNDGDIDLVVGNHDMRGYGWDDAFDAYGRWTAEGHHGYFFLLTNEADNQQPRYASPKQIMSADGSPLESYGLAGPCFSDWDNDGDLDLISGQFSDTLVYSENIGTRDEPVYTPMRTLASLGGPIVFENGMLWVTAVDWDQDGDDDLVVSQEDGRVCYLECSGGMIHGQPAFDRPKYFQQEARFVKVGVLVTPSAFDWDGDGDEDLICGNAAGRLIIIENLDGGDPPRFAAPRRLETIDGEIIRIVAGDSGSIQGPGEAHWGYTVPCVADWNHDGLPDIVVNSIWGQVVWYQNVGEPGNPRLSQAKPIEVDWAEKAPKPEWYWWPAGQRNLITQWRTTPFVCDVDRDGLNDLVMLDHEGYLAWFRRKRTGESLVLEPGVRIFKTADDIVEDGNRRKMKTTPGVALRLKDRTAGWSGRRKLALVDWDGDGLFDILINNRNIDFLRNVASSADEFVFTDRGRVDPRQLAGHTMAPTVVDWDKNGIPDLVVGAEDGRLYYMKNTRSESLSIQSETHND